MSSYSLKSSILCKVSFRGWSHILHCGGFDINLFWCKRRMRIIHIRDMGEVARSHLMANLGEPYSSFMILIIDTFQTTIKSL